MMERRWITLGALLMVVVAPNTVLGEPVRGAAVAEVALQEEALGALELASVREVERKAKERQLEFERAAAESEPMRRPDGSYEFAFSDKLMRIRCLKLRSCSVALEPGEVVPAQGGLNTNGDQFPVTYVHAAGRTYASIIPQADAADADISLFTNRGRVYRLHVVAVTEPLEHMAAISFRYPPSGAEIRDLLMHEEGRAPAAGKQEDAPDYQIEANMDDMYFGYEIEKEGRWLVRRNITWTPERAYDDGERTFIDFPKSVLVGERPILLVRYPDGTEALVNNAARGRHIIIGGLIDEAVLLKGIGRKQERVRIRRLKEDD
jgi:type IV secretion system protein TrbG